MNFKEFLTKPKYSTIEIVNMYFYERLPIKQIIEETGLCKKELYQIIRSFGTPNRVKLNHHNVIALADQGLTTDQVASLTNYSPQNVKYILKRRLRG
jgi:hypothetical protein